jgi:hypothetical protein
VLAQPRAVKVERGTGQIRKKSQKVRRSRESSTLRRSLLAAQRRAARPRDRSFAKSALKSRRTDIRAHYGAGFAATIELLVPLQLQSMRLELPNPQLKPRLRKAYVAAKLSDYAGRQTRARRSVAKEAWAEFWSPFRERLARLPLR